MWNRIAAIFLGSAVVFGGCATDPELVKRVDALEVTVQELASRPAGPAPADPKKEAAAEALAKEIQAAIAGMDDATVKAKSTEFKKKYQSTKAARFMRRVFAEYDVVGVEAGDMEVEKWYQGNVAMNDGKATMLVFWEVWCPHCKREVPKIEATYNKYKDQGLNLVGLTKVTRGSTEEQVTSFMTEEGVTYPMAKEQEGGNLSKRFGVRGVPAAAIVKGGKVVWRGHPARIDDGMITKLLQ